MRDGEPSPHRSRLAAGPPARRAWPRWGVAASVGLHALLAGLVVLALWLREKPEEPVAAAYDLEFADGDNAPSGGAAGDAVEPGPPALPAPGLADLPPAPADPAPPVLLPGLPPVVPDVPQPPLSPQPPRLAAPAPLGPPTVPEAPSPLLAVPRPSRLPPLADPIAPTPLDDLKEPTPELAELPLPPPPAPPAPARPAPPRTALPGPATPPSRPDLPGLWLPNGLALVPNAAPRRPGGAPGLDLAPSDRTLNGDGFEADLTVVGAKVGDEWYTAFRRWVRDHWRYPQEAVLLSQQGANWLEVLVDPSGQVRTVRLVRQSGSVYLDSRSQILFRNATIPPFPPGADPNGVTLKLRMRYILTRR